MTNRARTAKPCVVLAIAAGLSGCAGEQSATGRRILGDLERARIAVPDDAGRTQSADTGAELPASGPITLADLLRVAEARSPRLASARSGVGMAAGQRWQASLYPNPRADVAAEDISLRDGARGAKTTIGLTQPIVMGGRIGAAADAARAEQAAREAEVELQRRELFGEIAFEHARLLSIAAQQRLHEELLLLADRTLDAAQARFDARAAPETDVIRPRIERHRIDAALGRLGHERASARRRLSMLLGGEELDADRLVPAPLATPASLDTGALEAKVRGSHPALALQDREIDAAAARLARVRAERTPDLDVRVAAGYRGEEDDAIVEIGAGMALPLWDAREGDLLTARFELLRARQQRASVEHELLARLADAIGEHEAARTQWEALRDRIVPDALRAFEQTGEGYRGGRASFLDLLDAQRTLVEARVAEAEFAGVLAAARARVAQIVGPEGPGAAPWPGSASRLEDVDMRPSGAEVHP